MNFIYLQIGEAQKDAYTQPVSGPSKRTTFVYFLFHTCCPFDVDICLTVTPLTLEHLSWLSNTLVVL